MTHVVRSVSDARQHAEEEYLAGRATERRTEPRVPGTDVVRYRLPNLVAARWSHGVTLDLSEGGGSFLVDGAWRLVERIETDDFILIEVELPSAADIGDPIRLRGEVVWVQPDGGGATDVDRIGVRFRDLPVRQAARLRAELERARRN